MRVLFAGSDSGMFTRLANAARADEDVSLIGPATSTAETIDAAMSVPPQVILLDLEFGGTFVEGLKLAADLRRRAPQSNLLVYSVYTIDSMVDYALRIGVSGYVFKDIDPRALLAAIRTVASGGTVFSSAILQR